MPPNLSGGDATVGSGSAERFLDRAPGASIEPAVAPGAVSAATGATDDELVGGTPVSLDEVMPALGGSVEPDIAAAVSGDTGPGR